jgi:Mn-containing catalase
MFFRTNQFQYNAKPEGPDPVYAKKLQEVLGGQWGEISVMMTYLFQGWNCRAPQKYRDMILDIGTKEIAHVEMLATMIARLLETSPWLSGSLRRERLFRRAVGARIDLPEFRDRFAERLRSSKLLEFALTVWRAALGPAAL